MELGVRRDALPSRDVHNTSCGLLERGEFVCLYCDADDARNYSTSRHTSNVGWYLNVEVLVVGRLIQCIQY